MKKAKRENKKTLLIGLIFLLLALVAYFLQEQENERIGVSASRKVLLESKETQDRINYHLRETSREMTLKEQQSAIEEKRRLVELQNSKPQREMGYNPHQLEISEYQDRPMFNELVGRGKKESAFPSDPNELVQKELFHEQAEQQYSEAYKAEYTRQFIENARKEGWEIQVDSSYRVTKVRAVRPPDRNPSYKVFEGTSSGGR
jgi:hypothetical protein